MKKLPILLLGMVLATPALAGYNPSGFSAPPGVQLGSAAAALPSLNYVTPQMFGAKCDETTDDTTALQAAENAAGANQSAVAYIGPKLCKATAALVPKPGVDHFCFIGMNLADGDTTTGHDCGVLEQGGAWAWDMPVSGYPGDLHAPTWHDMAIDSAAGGIRIGTAALKESQPVAGYLRISRVTFSGPAGVENLDCTLCFYAVVDQSWFTNQVRFYMSDYVKVSNSSFQRQFNLDLLPQLVFLADDTFANSDVAEHNFFECPTGAGSTSCVQSTANSGTFQDNGFECQGTGLPTVLDFPAPSTDGGFSNIVKNNVVSCPSGSITNWLTVENTLHLYYLNAEGNSCSCTIASAKFNGGNGMPAYVPSTTALSQIFHSGNSSEGGFPFSSYNNAPNASSGGSGALMTWQPGGTSYTVGLTNYGASVMVAQGAWIQPYGATTTTELDFNQTPYSLVGILDICFKARAPSASTVETLVPVDGGTPGTPQSITLTGGTNPTWYCYKAHSYTVGAGVELKNNDATRANEVDIYQVNITDPAGF